MPAGVRPCSCGRAVSGAYDTGQCRPCWLFLNDARYAALWGEEPSLVAKITSFVGASARHVLSGSKRASDGEKARRLELCMVCVHKVEDADRCRLCGCGLKMKASWSEQKCPVGKW